MAIYSEDPKSYTPADHTRSFKPFHMEGAIGDSYKTAIFGWISPDTGGYCKYLNILRAIRHIQMASLDTLFL